MTPLVFAGCNYAKSAGEVWSTGEPEFDGDLDFPNFDDDGGGRCVGDDDGDEGMTITNAHFTGYTVEGYDGSARPTDPEGSSESPGNPVMAEHTDATCDGQTSWRPTNPGSGSTTWTATGGSNTFLRCGVAEPSGDPNACGDADACAGTYRVHIDPDTSENEGCKDYEPARITFVTVTATSNPVEVDEDHLCVAGSGRFWLAGYYGGDRDGDGLMHASYLPIMLSGSGVMTNDAWLRSIDFVEGDAGLLKVMLPGRDLVWTADDHLAEPADALPLSTHNAFAAGTMGGYPVFVAEEFDADQAGWKVDLSWDCPADPPPGLDRPDGYVLQGADIGCPDAPQRFVFRVLGGGERVAIELYGNASMAAVARTWDEPGGGLGFALSHGGYEAEGILWSWDDTSATVELTAIRAGDDDVCEPGTYVFPAE